MPDPLTHCARLGIEPASWRCSDMADPLVRQRELCFHLKKKVNLLRAASSPLEGDMLGHSGWQDPPPPQGVCEGPEVREAHRRDAACPATEAARAELQGREPSFPSSTPAPDKTELEKRGHLAVRGGLVPHKAWLLQDSS